jgi:hypothetical protein
MSHSYARGPQGSSSRTTHLTFCRLRMHPAQRRAVRMMYSSAAMPQSSDQALCTALATCSGSTKHQADMVHNRTACRAHQHMTCGTTPLPHFCDNFKGSDLHISTAIAVQAQVQHGITSMARPCCILSRNATSKANRRLCCALNDAVHKNRSSFNIDSQGLHHMLGIRTVTAVQQGVCTVHLQLTRQLCCSLHVVHPTSDSFSTRKRAQFSQQPTCRILSRSATSTSACSTLKISHWW